MPNDQQIAAVGRHIAAGRGLLGRVPSRLDDILQLGVEGAFSKLTVLMSPFTATTAAATNLGFGEAFVELIAGRFQPLSARVEFDVRSTGGAYSAGEIGIGTTEASGAINTLTGNEENILEGQALAPLGAGNSQTSQKVFGGLRTALTPGLTTPNFFLNFAVAGTAAGPITIENIRVDVYGIFMPTDNIVV